MKIVLDTYRFEIVSTYNEYFTHYISRFSSEYPNSFKHHLNMRVGIGYDVHRLVPGRKLILGGVEIPYHLGLLGHSDADVLTHAICDAILGAAALGDIGRHFPDTDTTYRGIDSLILLKNVKDLINNRGYTIQNIDSTIIAQKPKLAPYIPEMQGRLAETLEISTQQVNVKATTSEGVGFVGREEAIVVQAVVCLSKSSNV